MCEKTLPSFLQPSGCLILLSDFLFLMLQKPFPSRMVHLIPKQTSRVWRVSISEDHPWVTHPWTKQRRIPDPYKINSIETYTTHDSGGSSNNWLEIDGKTFAKPCIAGEYERVSKDFTMFHHHHHPAFLGCIPLESCFFWNTTALWKNKNHQPRPQKHETRKMLRKMPSPETKISYWKQIKF